VAPAEPARDAKLPLTPQSTLLTFVRRPEQPVTSGPHSMHKATLTVDTLDLGERPPPTLPDYLAFERRRSGELQGAEVRPGFRLSSSKFEIDDVMQGCLRFEQSGEDTSIAEFPGVPFAVHIRGYRCPHPRWPRYVVSVAYGETRLSGVEPFRIEGEVDPALRSLRTTPERPVFVTTNPVGTGSQGVVVYDGKVWVAWGEKGLARIDPRTNQVMQVEVGRDPMGVAAGPEGLWVANRIDATIVRVDPVTGTPGKPLRVDRPRPPSLARVVSFLLATAAGSVWVSDGPEVVRVDPVTGRVLAKIWVGTGPSGIAAAGDAIYATSYDRGIVVRIDPKTNEIVARQSLGPPLGYGKGVGAGVVAVGEGAVWVSCQEEESVYKLDPSDLHVLERIKFASRPSGIAVGAGAVWVTLYDEFTVVKIDPRKAALVGEPIPVGVRPVLAAWGAGALWITNAWSHNISRIDL
jgi:streptogramin lyase